MRYEIDFDSRRQYIWRFISTNGRILANGESYTAKTNALHCINLVKGTTSLSQYTFYEDVQGHWRWTLFATNGEIIAKSSEGYWNEADARTAAGIVMSSSASTPVYDLTVRQQASGY
jgi:uncharacterized protein YegP (UPF0339 family)